MRSAIILVLALCIGCKGKEKLEPHPGHGWYPEAEKALSDGAVLDTSYRKGDTLVNGVFYRHDDYTIDSSGKFIVDSAVVAVMQQAYADNNHLQCFFLVKYSSCLKSGGGYESGQRAFKVNGVFFRKTEFDSVVYASFPRKRECYQHILIDNLYQFKSREEFEAYSQNLRGDTNPKKQKECCDQIGYRTGPIQFTIDTVKNDTPREKEPRTQAQPGYYFGDPPWDKSEFGSCCHDSSFVFHWHGHECTVLLLHGRYVGWDMNNQNFYTRDEENAFDRALYLKIDSLGINKDSGKNPLLEYGDSLFSFDTTGVRLYIGKDTASYQGFGRFNGDADNWKGESLKADSLYLYALPTGRRISGTDSLTNQLIKKKKDSL